MQTKNDTKKVFKDCGTCSRTFAFLLNREFGNEKDVHIRALDPLAGGIMNTGHQCGMLWGSALAIGTEAYRITKDIDKSTDLTITTTKQLVNSFYNKCKTINCRTITGCKLDTKWGLLKFMLKTTLQGMKNNKCFNLAEEWAPEAIGVAKKAVVLPAAKFTQKPISCASEVIRKMGGTQEEMAMVSGFAGGLGLSGKACGALSAAIWMKTLNWCKANKGKNPPYFNNPEAKKVLTTFKSETKGKFLCTEICNQNFKDANYHYSFMKQGGCKELINKLAVS
jgi:YHS domain-containing protein